MSKQFNSLALVLAFLALITIVLGVGSLGLAGMNEIRTDANKIAETQWKNVGLTNQALKYSNDNSRINMQLVMTTNRSQMDSLLSRRAENSARISSILAQLQSRIGSPREKELLDAILENRDAYLRSYQHATALLIERNDTAEAQRTLMQETFPLLLKYHLCWGDFAHFQTDEMDAELQKSAAIYVAARKKTALLIALSILLAAAIAVFVVRKITAEILQREKAEKKIRRMNEELELKVLQRTAALDKSNRDLANQIAERIQVEERLRSKTAFLEAQANSTVDGILVVDKNSKKLLQNRRFGEIFQLPEPLLHDDDDEAALQHVVRRASDPEGFLARVRYLYDHADETSRDEIAFKDGMVLDRYSAPVIDKEGKYYGRIWVFRDITERKRNEEVVRRLSQAVEQSPVAVVITDLGGNIMYVNQNFVDCTGYPREEVIGKNPRILKSNHTSSEEYKRLWDTITAGKEWRGEFHNRKKNGELYWEYALIQPIKDEKGKISHFLALKEDITQRRSMEAQLQQAHKLEAIGQLAAGIAHEINTPMQFIGDNTRFVQEAWTSLEGLLSLFSSMPRSTVDESVLRHIANRIGTYETADLKYLEQEVPKAIGQSLEGIERVRNIVLAMKEFSHPGSDQKRPVDINKAIETTLTVARNEWKYVAELETIFADDIGLVPCHVGEFNQVILNLIVNAAHAIAQVRGDGSCGKGKITIRTVRESSGPGFRRIRAAEYLRRFNSVSSNRSSPPRK